MNCPRCDSPSETEALQQFGGVCPKCLLEFAAEKDAPAFPNLEILSTLGEGGMGVVYKAVQKQLGRTVALKVLSPQLSTDPSFVERFTREAKALASLSHPNIVGIFDSGVHDGVPYLIMEFVEGTSLRKLMGAKKLTADQALQVVPQICDALAYAHAHGVVHRDVKPENILLDREGRVKIADFGLAKLASPEQTRITRTNMVMGTPNYMAPEQIENPSAVDHRADLYSLGVIFYEMLTGELPLGRFKPPSERASTDRRLDPVVMKSLEKEPDDRYQTADEVKEHVTHLDSRREIRTGPRPVRRTARPMWMACAILALIAIATALEGGERSAAIWTGFAAAVCGVVALSRMGSFRPPEMGPHGPIPGRPPIRVVVRDPMKRTAVILAAVGALLLVPGLALSGSGLGGLGAPPLMLSVLFLLVAFVVSLVALVRHALRRAAGGSTGWAMALIVIVMLLLAGMLSRSAPRKPHAGLREPGSFVEVPAPSPVPPAIERVPYSTVRLIQHAGPFRMAKVWPTPDDLAGLSRESESEGADAIREAGFPDGFQAGVSLVRRCTFLDGTVELMGLEFRSEAARARWLAEIARSVESEPRGKSLQVFLLRYGDSVPQDATARAIEAVLRRKMEEPPGKPPD